ncbi:hypothetical protein RRG08_048799 [Elysia crispata]|uniref:Uncharacterized protein n=1 Tax=Elysia crispata TaxID=231223 RepID=A0AAE1AN80_9GAST|nr:hypothetical protein RRG08_048799 [Elysia crispata]
MTPGGARRIASKHVQLVQHVMSSPCEGAREKAVTGCMFSQTRGSSPFQVEVLNLQSGSMAKARSGGRRAFESFNITSDCYQINQGEQAGWGSGEQRGHLRKVTWVDGYDCTVACWAAANKKRSCCQPRVGTLCIMSNKNSTTGIGQLATAVIT